MFGLDGTTALVTGGSRGIGRAVSVALAVAGSHVVINYRSNAEAAEQTRQAIEAAGGRATLAPFDVADAVQVHDAVKRIGSEIGTIDILVNNAGLSIDNLLLRVSPEDLDTTWSTNVNSAIFCTKACIRGMMRSKWGRVVNLSSVVAESGNPGQTAYSASKAALIGLTRTLAKEYASRGITVNAVAPGYIETDMTAGLNDAVRAQIVSHTPVGRVGTPEEVAAAVLFLCSKEASYVTGQVLRVNGGMYV